MAKVSSTKKLVSASALMASGTLVSRALGLVRVMMIAFIFGNSSRQADMLALATMVPNSLYILFAGGALNTVLVPQIVRAIRNDPDGGEAYTNRIMTAFMLIVLAVAVVVTIAAPVVTSLYSSDAWRAPELADQYASMVALTYLTLPQVFFYGAFFLLGQVLNARDRFGPMMWAPIANNVISVAVLSLYFVVWGNQGDKGAAFTTAQLLVLGIGSTVGIAAQSLVLLPYLRKVGFRFRPRFDLKGTGLGKTFSLTKWTMGFVAVNQIALLIVTRLGTTATAAGAGGGVDVYSKAHLIWILPHSLITVSLTTAMLPNASRLAAANNLRGVSQEALKTMRLALVALVPASVGFFVLAGPIAGLLFGHGQGSTDAGWVAWALMGFAVGLVPFTVQFVCLRTYYAMEDTRTPFLLQCVIAAVNAGLALVLVWAITSRGYTAAALALAYSVAYLVGVFLSWRFLRRKLHDFDSRVIVMHIVRLLLGAAAGGVIAYFLSVLLVGQLGSGVLGNGLSVIVGLAVIGVVYLLLGKALRVREFQDLGGLVRSLLRRGGKAKTPKATEPAETTDGASRDEPSEPGGGTHREPLDSSAEAADAEESSRAALEDIIATQVRPAVQDFDELSSTGWWEPVIPDEDMAGAFDAGLAETQLAEEGAIDSAATREFDAPARFLPPAPEPGTAAPVPAPVPGEPERGTDRADGDGEASDGDAPVTEGWESQGAPEAPVEEPQPEPVPVGYAGALLDTRYRLDEQVATRAGIETWRAHDLVLSRSVLVHLLGEGDARIPDVIESARRSAVATDSRFLRVLDAVETDAEGIGAFVVCEYVEGASLTRVLRLGPLEAVEAAFVVHELADALTGMHAQGLFHDELNPDNVILTDSGDVRLVGFGTENAIVGTDIGSSWGEREAADVKGLASLLYACLVQRWPGGAGFGLEAAPIIAGEPAGPRIVRAGVPASLDRIASAALTERGSAADRRITTVSQLSGALADVLGTRIPTEALEERVERTLRAPAVAEPMPELSDEMAATLAGLTVPRDTGAQAVPVPAPAGEPAEPESEATRTLPPAAAADSPAEPRDKRPVLWLVGTLLVAALIIWLVISAINSARDTSTEPDAGGQETITGEATPGADGTWEIVAARDFDPEADGGNDEENPDAVGLAIDGDPSTGWSTLRYHNRPDLGGLKPGVGLVLDLGEPRPIHEVSLLFAASGADVEIRVPQDADATAPPMTSQSEWTVVASQDDVPTEATLALEEEASTRYVLVYLTSLPQVEDDRFLAELNEVQIS